MIIYKYMSVDKNKIESIDNGLFRFTQARELNDRFEGNWANNRNQISPKEINEYIQHLKNEGNINPFEISIDDVISLNTIIPAIDITPRNFPGLFIGSEEEKLKYKEKYIHDIEDMIIEETNNYCIFSTSIAFNSQLLWSHYASSEKGIIIGFYADHDYFKDLKKVNYSNTRPNINSIIKNWQQYSDFDKGEEINKWIMKSLYKKSKCWKYEKEYRLVKKVEEADEHKENNTVHLFKIPFEAWESIYYGSELDSIIESMLQKTFYRSSNKHKIKRIKVIKDIEMYSYQYIMR